MMAMNVSSPVRMRDGVTGPKSSYSAALARTGA